ncbi:MAG: PilN domain-containing protein [Armatimonadota bacterium]
MTIKGVDLLPAEKKKITLDPLIFILIIIIICSLGIFWVVGKQYEQKINAAKDQIAQVDEEIKQIESRLPEINSIKKDIDMLRQQIYIIEEKKRDPLKYRNILKEIATIMPVNSYLTRMDIEPSSRKVSLSGLSVFMPDIPPLNSIANFIRNLQSSDIFQNVNMGSAGQVETKGGGYGYNFSLDVNFIPEKAAGIDKEELLKQIQGGAR